LKRNTGGRRPSARPRRSRAWRSCARASCKGHTLCTLPRPHLPEPRLPVQRHHLISGANVPLFTNSRNGTGIACRPLRGAARGSRPIRVRALRCPTLGRRRDGRRAGGGLKFRKNRNLSLLVHLTSTLSLSLSHCAAAAWDACADSTIWVQMPPDGKGK
jgi:hypothetical protein